MKKRKMLAMVSAMAVTATALTGLWAGTVYAVEGWSSQGKEWQYLDSKNEPESNVWRQSRGDSFYLGPDGFMKKNCFIEQGTGLYHVDERGARAEKAWYFNPEDDGQGHGAGWYYFGSNGKAYRRTDSSFKRNIDGKTYVFDENGVMLTGWLDEKGYPLGDGENPLEDGIYYADEDGALKTESWLDYAQQDLTGLDGLYSNITGKDYNEYDSIWLYFNAHSKKLKSNGDQLLQRSIGGNTYGFDEYGIMLPWWGKVASVSNADKSSATSDVPAKFFAGYDGGKLLKNAWIWMYPSDNLLASDYNSGVYSWWRTDENGEVYRNRIKRINGRYYAFDGLGRMQTGFVLFENRSAFVAQYDSDVWTSDWFIDGEIYGQEKGSLYFFDPDELNDGSMQTGDAVMIELADGVHAFGFDRNGVAYGDKNRMKRVKDSFYINGLRLDADEEYGYGIVQDGAGSYRVVNTDGKVISGNRRIVKDGDGAWLIILNGRFAARVEDGHKPVWHSGAQGTGYYHYDPDQKEDKYAGGLIAKPGDPAILDGLPEEENLTRNLVNLSQN